MFLELRHALTARPVDSSKKTAHQCASSAILDNFRTSQAHAGAVRAAAGSSKMREVIPCVKVVHTDNIKMRVVQRSASTVLRDSIKAQMEHFLVHSVQWGTSRT